MTDQFKYGVANKPTEYGGIHFRSRHEAQWAAFFDVVGWQWDYEPFDLIGWSPDFLLHGLGRNQSPRAVLVEVKPYDDINDKLYQKFEDAIQSRNSDEDVLFLGTGPILVDGFVSIGKLGQNENFYGDDDSNEWNNGNVLSFAECVLCKPWFGDSDFPPVLEAKFKSQDLKADICHSEQNYSHRITGVYAGGSHNPMSMEEARKYWGEAKKRTQFQVKKNSASH